MPCMMLGLSCVQAELGLTPHQGCIWFSPTFELCNSMTGLC